MSRREGRFPAFKTVGLSIFAGAAGLLVWSVWPDPASKTAFTAVAIGLAAGLGAFAAGWFLGLGRAWCVLAILATPALVLTPIFQPPIWLFPLFAFLLGGFYFNGVTEKVPLYLSNAKTRAAVAELLPPPRPAREPVFIDLGCGLGGAVLAIARARPDVQAIGVETAPFSFAVSWLRITLLGPANARIRFQSLWSTDLSQADVVYAFLSPAPMPRLNGKVHAEMKSGAIFVSNSFAVPGDEPDRIVTVDDDRRTRLLIWQM